MTQEQREAMAFCRGSISAYQDCADLAKRIASKKIPPTDETSRIASMAWTMLADEFATGIAAKAKLAERMLAEAVTHDQAGRA